MSAQTGTRSSTAATATATATATVIDSPERAQRLADHLLDPQRSRPAVLVTVAAGQPGPYIKVEAIVEAVSELADVYVLATGSITFALSDRLPAMTQVYGGAGRIYPVDPAWQSDPYAAPLRFAFGAAQGPVATDRLIADALGAVHAGGQSTRRAGATVHQVDGKVKALFAPARVWVGTTDGGVATIWQDLLFPGLPIERVFQRGMRISGALDVEQSRIDVSASVRKPGDALVDYAVGAVVLARVVSLDNIAAMVELYPGVRTGLSATEVTGNPNDQLMTLMSIDEVIPVRVTSRGGHDGRGWRLSMLDVEDDEAIRDSPSLLPGGPPWLVMAELAPEPAVEPSAQKARTALRTAKQRSQQLAKQLKAAKAEGKGQSDGDVLFLDPEKQFRYDVDVAYAHRISPGDKEIRPLREFRIGPDFLATLKAVEGVERGKVVDVTVEILTDLVTELDGRELHSLREGAGAAERDVRRSSDRARSMRVALQRNTPSARRLHYWKVGEAIELSRVVVHDDMRQ